jgi:hypothetical protein
MSVSKNPGAMQFTVMPREPTSIAKLFVMPTNPALLALYATCPALPHAVPTMLEMLMIRPLRRDIIPRSTAREHNIGPLRFVANT